MGKLDGKVAIITGASRGIGRETARLFAEEGARVVLAARTLHEGDHQLPGSLDSTVQQIRDAGGEASAVTCDVSSEDDCGRLVEQAKSLYGPVDVLVNNAALNYYIPVVDYPVSRWMRAFAVNVHGPFMLSKFVLPDMIERRSGAIVNISSMGAVGPGRGPYAEGGGRVRGGSMYGASKAALERFTQGLAQEVYEHGVSVTCVSPSVGVPTGHRIPQAARVAGRPTRRAGADHGALHSAARQRAAREGERPRDLLAGHPQGVRLD
jgi:citronellol/citronellal dehydrogenase